MQQNPHNLWHCQIKVAVQVPHYVEAYEIDATLKS